MNFDPVIEEKILKHTALSGGCIGKAFRVETEKTVYFVKHYSKPGMAEEEARGLEKMRATKTVKVPRPLRFNENFLVLNYITQGRACENFQERLGRELAEMHKKTMNIPEDGRRQGFGFFEDNHIGDTPQKNGWKKDWVSFYTENRLDHQVRLAEDPEISSAYEKLKPRIATIIGNSAEPPCLIHGDLWGGNVICNRKGEPILIDPAACYAHRELELAMTGLFGGFSAAFYRSYEVTFPLKEGWRRRQDFYKLYHILNHFNLFGASYKQQALSLMRTYL